MNYTDWVVIELVLNLPQSRRAYMASKIKAEERVLIYYKRPMTKQIDGKVIVIEVCPDCAVEPGQCHVNGCDVERCSVCGSQKLSCDCEGHDKRFARWSGFWPGELESKALGIDLNQFYMLQLNICLFIRPNTNEDM